MRTVTIAEIELELTELRYKIQHSDELIDELERRIETRINHLVYRLDEIERNLG